ncbi:DegV family protein [Streptococcus sp. CSL10205-OR2]|uniref:DegV family protein n=1 Tax=Streptococcus sp. CSL10205-OR2 TaxID=2980558 RepID=UPI0021D9D864|nr:DegV family protein [Streptococcus sp. CSL10205-OR2]MCU9534271.1 DegV family protein [Streptococcus sp. CSL10205-OR2]
MANIKIVTDSSITIESELLEKYNITVVPLSVMVDGTLYSDNDLKEGQFLSMMKNSTHLPKTSQPPVGLFAETYENIFKEGYDTIISIHITHSLSGTVEAARQGAALAGGDIIVLDSSFTDQAMKYQVVEAAKFIQEGKSREDILARIEEVKNKTELFIGLSTLENLIKGGRVSRVAGIISSLFNIKIVMALQNHELHPVIKGRGTKTFFKWLTELSQKLENKAVAEITISYAGTNEFANQLKEQLQKLVETDIVVLETGSIIQTHTGEGAFAIMIRYE